ncbi:MAG: TlpA family protein disulfide reductase [Vicinamibacteria bacterium]|nr:TlpA family protein disulfide reductase [Vicinamibacteria bacterium]
MSPPFRPSPKPVLLGLLAAVLAFGLAHAAEAVVKPRPAPAFSLKDTAGQSRTLAEFRGRVVLVDFWASWCAPCKASFPALDSLQEEFRGDGVEVVAINVDEDPKNAASFLAGRSPSMTVLFDPKGVSPQDFKVEGMPSSFLIDREGQVRFEHTGFTERTKFEFRREIEILLKESLTHAQK